MNLKKTTSILTILSILLFVNLFANSQETKENQLTKGIQFFDNGNFAEAEPIFKTILKENPDDFMANYFYGGCRTENMHFTNSDLDALIKANQEVSPVDISYYFGMQYHARSNWERALKFYNKYKAQASLADEDQLKLLILIQQCYDKINPYQEFLVEENIDEIIPVIAASATIAPDTLSASIDTTANSEIQNEAIVAAPVLISQESDDLENEEIEFYVSADITYLRLSHFKTEEGKKQFEEGKSKEEELENLLLTINELRNKYGSTRNTEEKKLIGEEILGLENETYSLKTESAQLLLQAKNLEAEYWEKAGQEETETFKEEIFQLNHENKNQAMENETDFDSTDFINPTILMATQQILSPDEEKKEPDLIYRIQIGAYSKGVPNYIQKLFDQLSQFRKIENYTDPNGIVVYTTGNLTKYEDALKMQNQVQKEGIEDARVVPYFKGKRITLKEAKELEAL